MLVMSRLAPDTEESLSGALVRAKLCELCVAAVGGEPAPAFTVGLLSALPDTLGRPIADIVAELALSAELRRALLDHEGPLGRVLGWAIAYESGDQDRLAEVAAPPTITDMYLDALRWANDLTGVLSADRS